MQEKTEMIASEFPMANTEDFIKMIYVRLYGQRKNMKYTVEVTEEIEVNGYRFKDFVIHKKG